MEMVSLTEILKGISEDSDGIANELKIANDLHDFKFGLTSEPKYDGIDIDLYEVKKDMLYSIYIIMMDLDQRFSLLKNNNIEKNLGRISLGTVSRLESYQKELLFLFKGVYFLNTNTFDYKLNNYYSVCFRKISDKLDVLIEEI